MVKLDRKWALAACAMVLVIWGNSLVPGTGSGSLSLSIMESIRGFLQALGLPYEWVTNFVVRKCAHFSEYAVLGGIARTFWARVSRELGSRASSSRRRVLLAGLVLTTLVPCLDETIQLFVPGRSGSPRDVAIDLAGAATGALLTWLFHRARTRER